MPKLKCDVSNCGNNAEGCCCRGAIEVTGGENAVNTCCTNFMEGSGATNAYTTPNESLSVACNAHDCAHNENSQCCADSIDVSGMGASNAVETQCSSFCSRC